MPTSARYRQLRIRLHELEGLLPETRLAGTYTAREVDQVRAFRLLSHAEVEAFLEDTARGAAAAAVNGWLDDGRPRHSVWQMVLLDTHRDLPKTWQSMPLNDRAKRVLERYSSMLDHNNGVKEANILKMLLPIGVFEVDLSSTWLAMMNSFGTERGETAHSAKAVQTPPDPVVELGRIRQITAELAVVDKKLISLPRRRVAANVFSRLPALSDSLNAVRRR